MIGINTFTYKVHGTRIHDNKQKQIYLSYLLIEFLVFTYFDYPDAEQPHIEMCWVFSISDISLEIKVRLYQCVMVTPQPSHCSKEHFNTFRDYRRLKTVDTCYSVCGYFAVWTIDVLLNRMQTDQLIPYFKFTKTYTYLIYILI